jgi:hypothetical protein
MGMHRSQLLYLFSHPSTLASFWPKIENDWLGGCFISPQQTRLTLQNERTTSREVTMRLFVNYSDTLLDLPWQSMLRTLRNPTQQRPEFSMLHSNV